jgi:hypothetical protein
MYWRLLPALGRIVPEQCNRLNMCVTGNFDFTSLIPWLAGKTFSIYLI